MGYFLGQKMPTYNPFWEEEDYKDQPDWWKWYHFGYDEGYAAGSDYYEQDAQSGQRAQQKIEALEALIAANFRVNKDLVLNDTQNKTPDEQS